MLLPMEASLAKRTCTSGCQAKADSRLVQLAVSILQPLALPLLLDFFVAWVGLGSPAVSLAFGRLSGARAAPGAPGGVAASALAFLDRSLAYDRKIAPLAGGSVAAGAVLLAAELTFDTPLRLLNAVAHCAFGAAAYYLWKLLPCYDKTDELPTFR